MSAGLIVALVWKELLHYLGERLVLLTLAEVHSLQSLTLEDIVKHLRDLAAKSQSQEGESVPTDSPTLVLGQKRPNSRKTVSSIAKKGVAK